jgi:Fur family iron response transcriptional regulator
MRRHDLQFLRDHGISPSAQRVAVASYVLHTDEHPSADEVLKRVRERLPMISRATVYNTLNLFVQKKILREFVLTEGRVLFDANIDEHHHFIDQESGAIYDIPWSALRVSHIDELQGFDVNEYQVVIKGRKRPAWVTR